MRPRPLAAAALAALALAACADRTALLVVVSSTELHVPADVDTLHFEARSVTGRSAAGDYAVSADWPQSIAIRPAVGEGGEVVTVTVLALQRGAVVARAVKTAMLVSGTTTTVAVTLVRCTTDCGTLGDAGMPDGGMQDAGPPPPDMPGTELGPDLGVDLGPRDSGPDLGPPDLGPPDLGPPDLGPPDLGMPGSCATGGCATHLVISEVATGGPTAALDEFVELYNPTASDVDASGLLVEYNAASGASWGMRATLPAGAILHAHGYYLVGSSAYAGAAAVDPGGGWSGGFAAAGGHVRISLGGTELDRFAWGTAVMPEGTAAPATASTAGSYERKAFSTSTATTMQPPGVDVLHGNSLDDEMNAADFVVRTARDPQNSASPLELP